MIASVILFVCSLLVLGAALILSSLGIIPVTNDVILQYGIPFVIALIPTRVKVIQGMGIVNSLTAQRLGVNPVDNSKLDPEEADKWVALVIKVIAFIFSLLKKSSHPKTPTA